MTLERTITDWTNELLAQQDPALFLVSVEVSPGDASPGTRKVRVYLDGDQGVSIDTCAEVSRALAHRMDEEELIADPYTLEVSSAGLSQPLLLRRQYVKNVGRHVKVTLEDDKTVQGKLLAVADEQITVAAEPAGRSKKKPVEPTETTIAFSNIKKTNVLALFN
jgi:ribosome maturation factor RimP